MYTAEVVSKTQVVLAPPIVMVILSLVIPLLVGAATKWTLAPAVKAMIMLVLNALNAFIVTAIVVDGSAVFTREAFINFVLAVVTSVATYFGVYKPLNVTSSTPDGLLAPHVGIGPEAP